MKFSILIPSIPQRIDMLMKLYNKIQKQAEGYDVEVLIFLDNKKRSIGYKRDALVQIAKGEYCAFVDDDDDVSDDYIESIVNKIDSRSYDVIAINTIAIINGVSHNVYADYNYENEDLKPDTKRKPFHTSVWRTSIAQSERFADAGYGEDWDWVKRLLPKIKTHSKIDKFLHYYIFDSNVTAAPVESNSIWTNPNL